MGIVKQPGAKNGSAWAPAGGDSPDSAYTRSIVGITRPSSVTVAFQLW